MPNSAMVSFSHGGRLYLQKPQKAYRHLRLPITNYPLPITHYRTYLTFTRKAITLLSINLFVVLSQKIYVELSPFMPDLGVSKY